MTIQWHRSLLIDQSFELPQWNCRGAEDFVAAHFFGNIFSEVREQLHRQANTASRSSYKNTCIKYIYISIYPVRRIILGGHSTGHVTDNPLPLLDSSSLQPPSTNTAAAAPLMRLAIAQRAAALARTCGFKLPRDLTLNEQIREISNKARPPEATRRDR